MTTEKEVISLHLAVEAIVAWRAAQGHQPGGSEIEFPSQAVRLQVYLLVSIKFYFFFIAQCDVCTQCDVCDTESESQNHLSKVLLTIIYVCDGLLQARLFGVEQQRCFLLNEKIAIFCF